jgi:hypothetical protein
MIDNTTEQVYTEFVREKRRPADSSGAPFAQWYVDANAGQETVPGVLLTTEHEPDASESQTFMEPIVALQLAGQLVLAVQDGLTSQDKCTIDNPTRGEIAAELASLRTYIGMMLDALPSLSPP